MIREQLAEAAPLDREYVALVREHGSAQLRCSELVSVQACEIERLRGEAVRLRAAVIVRETALMWAREDQAALERAIPGLPRRVTLARRVEALVARLQDLLRERARGQWFQGRVAAALPPVALEASVGLPFDEGRASERDVARLEASLQAADLVICQTGCLSHGAYWRVQDHCKRTGKACVMAQQPQAVRIVRISQDADGQDGATAVPASQGA